MNALQQLKNMTMAADDMEQNPGNSSTPLILFGAGFRFSTVEKLLIERNIAYVVTDNDKKKKMLSPQATLNAHKNSPVCISVGYEAHYYAMYDQLIQMGVSPERMIDFRELVFWLEGVTPEKIAELRNMLADQASKDILDAFCNFDVRTRLDALRALSRPNSQQYFDEDIVKVKEDEIFIDAGGYTGDTIRIFIDRTHNRFRSIHSFEPSKANIGQFNEVFFRDARIHIHPSGLGDQRMRVRFNNKGAASMMTNDGEDVVQIEKLDDVLGHSNGASFIKMDIEGAELNALKGAERTIRECKPTLAISVYHKDMDVFHIAEFLKNCVPNYRFFLRHYSDCDRETVLYAKVD